MPYPASIRHRRLAVGPGLRFACGDGACRPSWRLRDLPPLAPDRARLGVYTNQPRLPLAVAAAVFPGPYVPDPVVAAARLRQAC
jgi:hypothetical protein